MIMTTMLGHEEIDLQALWLSLGIQGATAEGVSGL